MATIPRSMLIAASSPYGRSGALWDAYRRNYGADDPSILVCRAPTGRQRPHPGAYRVREGRQRAL